MFMHAIGHEEHAVNHEGHAVNQVVDWNARRKLYWKHAARCGDLLSRARSEEGRRAYGLMASIWNTMALLTLDDVRESSLQRAELD